MISLSAENSPLRFLICIAFLACGRPSVPPNGELDVRTLDTLHATSIDDTTIGPRALAVEQFRRGRGEVRLTRNQRTNEGDPIRDWLLVRDGTARWILDASADRFRGAGPPVRQCSVTLLGLVAILEPDGSAVEIALADSARYRGKRVHIAARAECSGEDPFELHF